MFCRVRYAPIWLSDLGITPDHDQHSCMRVSIGFSMLKHQEMCEISVFTLSPCPKGLNISLFMTRCHDSVSIRLANATRAILLPFLSRRVEEKVCKYPHFFETLPVDSTSAVRSQTEPRWVMCPNLFVPPEEYDEATKPANEASLFG